VTAVVPGRLYGLRTWGIDRSGPAPRLTGPYLRTAWPAGGAPLHATCDTAAHAAPAPGCACGLHAWHPRMPAARRVLAHRFELPGILEAWGPVEVHEAGFRAAVGRPQALLLTPGRHPGLIHELADAHGAEVLEIPDAAALVRHCREHGLGMSNRVVEDLIGPERLAARRVERRRGRRHDVRRVLAWVAICGAMGGAGAYFAAHEAPGPKHLSGRTGPIVVP
jgi:hypothetical protein